MGDLSKDFSRDEFSCPCCNFDTVDAELVNVLQDLRDHYNSPVTVLSGCRCLLHNDAVGGSDDSQHLRAKAGDIKMKGVSPIAIYTCLKRKYPTKYGIGLYSSWVHVDVRPEKARW